MGSEFFGEYKSGDNLVQLKEDNGNYKVIANGSTVLETDEPRRAIARYYRSISNLIDANTEDKDVALDLLGDQIVVNNRQAIAKLSELGRPKEAEELKGFNLAYIDFPFDEELFLKDSQFAAAPPSSGVILGDPEKNYESSGAGDISPRKFNLKRTAEKFKDAIRLKSIQPMAEEDWETVVSRELPTPSKVKKDVQTKTKPEKPIFWNMEDDITSGGFEGIGFRDWGRGKNNKPIKVRELWKH